MSFSRAKGLKYADHMTINTPVNWMYNILYLNVQLQMESVLNLEVISDKPNPNQSYKKLYKDIKHTRVKS